MSDRNYYQPLASPPSKKSNIQAVLFDVNKFNTKKARKWLKKNNFEPMKRVHITERYLRYRIRNPMEFQSFRTKKLGKSGVVFIYGL